jgi:hypothetical protein
VQTAEGFKLEVYRIVKESELAQSDYKFRSQILEAARSVPSNVTEGFLRCSPSDFMRFLTTQWPLSARLNDDCTMAFNWVTSPRQPARRRSDSRGGAPRLACDSSRVRCAT